jgi:hypothetical protein
MLKIFEWSRANFLRFDRTKFMALPSNRKHLYGSSSRDNFDLIMGCSLLTYMPIRLA